MTQFFQDFFQSLGEYLPVTLGAIAILVIGWLIALILAAVVRGIIRRMHIDKQISKTMDEGEPVAQQSGNLAQWVGKFTYWIVMLIVIVAALEALNLTVAAEPINQMLNAILSYLPQVFGAIVLVAAAWLIASVVKFLVVKVVGMLKLDERLSDSAEVKTELGPSFAETIGGVVYWLIFLLFLPAILGALGLEGLLFPVQDMVDEFLGVLPNLVAAGLILLFGWIGARIVRQIVTKFLAGIGTDKLGESTGLSKAIGDQPLSKAIGTVLYVFMLVPVVIAALNALDIEAVTGPATVMLTTILEALPPIFGAILLLAVAYFAARLVGTFVTSVLTAIGFNRVLSWIGLGGEISEGRTPSEIVGYVAVAASMFFAVIEAANLLGFTVLSEITSQLLVGAGQIVIGLVVFGIGLYLANLAARVVRDSGVSQANVLAPASRVAIIVFSAALGLREMGIAQDIVNLAFGLLLGAVAVSVALAFGLGSREIASREVERWLDSWRR
jgi:TRAP-type mannitol/chloroaromatic compound transport system permease small subunit